MHGSTAWRAWNDWPTMDGVCAGGREAFVACGSNYKPLGPLVAEILVEKGFTIITGSRGPTFGFRCEPVVC